MIKINENLKSILFGKKFVKQINFGNKVLLSAENIYIDGDTNLEFIKTHSVDSDGGEFSFLKDGYIETKNVCEEVNFYGICNRAGAVSHNMVLFEFLFINVLTGDQLFKVTLNTGPNESGDDDIADRYYVTTVYDAQNNLLGSFTRSGAYGQLYTHRYIYDWDSKSYVFSGGGYYWETGQVKVKSEFIPFKLKIINAYNGTNPLELGFDYDVPQGLRIYKNYIVE